MRKKASIQFILKDHMYFPFVMLLLRSEVVTTGCEKIAKKCLQRQIKRAQHPPHRQATRELVIFLPDGAPSGAECTFVTWYSESFVFQVALQLADGMADIRISSARR